MDDAVIAYSTSAHEAAEAAVLAAIERGVVPVLDLDALDSLETGAVRALISMLRRARAAGGDFTLRTTRPEILRTLSVTGLDRVFSVVQPEVA